MNCRRCGAIIPNGGNNCPACGTPVAPVQPVQTAQPVQPVAPGAAYAPVRPVAPKPASKTSILDKVMQGPSFTVAGVKVPVFAAAAAVVALLLVILLAVLIFGGNSPEDIAETYIEANYFGDADADDVLDLYPEEYVEYLLDEYDIDEDDLIASIEDYLEDRRDECEDEEFELDDIEIRSVKDKKKKDYDEIVEFFDDEFDLEVEGFKLVKCKVYYEEEGDEESDTLQVLVVEIDGDYYIADQYWLASLARNA